MVTPATYPHLLHQVVFHPVLLYEDEPVKDILNCDDDNFKYNCQLSSLGCGRLVALLEGGYCLDRWESCPVVVKTTIELIEPLAQPGRECRSIFAGAGGFAAANGERWIGLSCCPRVDQIDNHSFAATLAVSPALGHLAGH